MQARLLLVALLSAVLGAACFGGGGELDTTPPTAGPTPTLAPVTTADRTYVRAVCFAFNNYLNALNAEAERDRNLFADQAKLLRVAAPILEKFSEALGKARPPKDIASFHNSLTKRVGEMSKQAKSGTTLSASDISTLSAAGLAPPGTIRQRLIEASQGQTECAEIGIEAFLGPPD